MKLNQWMAGAAILLATSVAQAGVSKIAWGTTTEGKPVALYTLSNDDLKVQITTFGARIVSIEAPDRNGKKADVVLGYPARGAV